MNRFFYTLHLDIISGYLINEYGECYGEKILLKGYREVLKKGDNVLSVHIPSGEPFDKERCLSSFERAKHIFKTYYPEYEYKCFTCYSWLMEKRLKEIIGKETNITRFADLFHAFPTCSDGKAHYSIFKMGKDVPYSDYPENTSIQKAVKKHLLDGGYFYFKGGIIVD